MGSSATHTHSEPLQVENLRIAFGREVLHESLNFSVHAGEIFVILGGSGSGKSVLMRHIVGLMQPAGGRVLLYGEDLAHTHGEARVALLRRIGVMFQLGALFGSMTLLQNVRLPLEEHTDLDDEAIDLVARMKLDLVGLKGFEDYLPARISGGMIKRAAIARAMALDPQLLLLDEPSAGLDPISSAGVDSLILQLRDSLGITFVVVTHELSSIERIADRAIMLDKERHGIVAEGTPAELKANTDDEWVHRFFHRKAETEHARA